MSNIVSVSDDKYRIDKYNQHPSVQTLKRPKHLFELANVRINELEVIGRIVLRSDSKCSRDKQICSN